MAYTTTSDQETKKIASEFIQKLKDEENPVIIALHGELGAGKTTFTQGLAEGLGITDKVLSPTFIVMRQHPVPESKKTLYHLDLYRLDEKQSLEELGLHDLFSDPEAIVVIEWPEKLSNHLPTNTITITLESLSENERKIEIIEPNQ